MKSAISSIYFILVFIGTPLICLAQGPYFSVDLGLNSPAGKQVVGKNITPSTEENVYGSFGKGVSIGFNLGTMFTENFGGEINATYLFGSEYLFDYTHHPTFPAINVSTSSSMLRIIPAIKMTTGDKMKPYLKLGFILGINPSLEIEGTGSGLSSKFTEKYTYQGRSSTGLLCVLGADFKLSSTTSFFMDLNFIYQNWIPKIIEYESTSEIRGQKYFLFKTYYFSDSLYVNSNDQLLQEVIPFSSIGLHIGLKFNFRNASGKEVRKD
jgi:hypothetical protein